VLLACAPMASGQGGDPVGRTTTLLSRSMDGGFPNAPSRKPVISHDARIGEWVAYESSASDIVPGDSNGVTDVFLVRRDGPYGSNGTPWRPGGTSLASEGMGGEPANGHSYAAALDGSTTTKPSCVAFVSEASNLVPGDTNGQPDAFIRDLSSGRIARVSVDSSGREALGPTTEVSVDGRCERVAFVADAPNLALKSTNKPSYDSARSTIPRPGSPQVYVRILRGRGADADVAGLTFLASASHKTRKASNGPSFDVDMSVSGFALAFASQGTNLVRGDRHGASDIYKLVFRRESARVRGKRVRQLRFDLMLVSQNRSGRPGNANSRNPTTTTGESRFVAYETIATNLIKGDNNRVSDVLQADTNPRRPNQGWVSKSLGKVGNGPSHRPSSTDNGNFVFYDSQATNLKFDQNPRYDDGDGRESDFFLAIKANRGRRTGQNWMQSLDKDNNQIPTAAHSPSASSRGNYVPFETAWPFTDPGALADDRDLAFLTVDPAMALGSIIPLIDPGQRGAQAPPLTDPVVQRPELQQVYLRYTGPR
jgi:hypothetical protein